MTVAELRRRMSSEELTLWMGFFRARNAMLKAQERDARDGD